MECAAGSGGHLYRSACLLTSGDTHLAEDLVQETLSRMYALWGRISRTDNPAAYAQTVLVRTFLTQRRRYSASERPLADVPELPVPHGADDPALRLALLQALRELPPTRRTAGEQPGVIELRADALRVNGLWMFLTAYNAPSPTSRKRGAEPAVTLNELKAMAASRVWLLAR
ncbi:sigma factor [Streptomyces longwoodensis]|uniref:sigma factor n=1 Tax=Streptomyces longwoodensis TaxID=68231 RepID=UPI00340A463B